jgi:hypothetical protein
VNTGTVGYLGFYETFVPGVLDGSKHVTIRRRTKLTPKAGERIELRHKRTHVFATAVVASVTPFRITDAPYWARQDGHATGAALVRELRKVYGAKLADLVVISLIDVLPAVVDVDTKGELL